MANNLAPKTISIRWYTYLELNHFILDNAVKPRTPICPSFLTRRVGVRKPLARLDNVYSLLGGLFSYNYYCIKNKYLVKTKRISLKKPLLPYVFFPLVPYFLTSNNTLSYNYYGLKNNYLGEAQGIILK